MFAKQAIVDRVRTRIETMKAEEVEAHEKAMQTYRRELNERDAARAQLTRALTSTFPTLEEDQLPHSDAEWAGLCSIWLGTFRSRSSWGIEGAFEKAASEPKEPVLDHASSKDLEAALDAFISGAGKEVSLAAIDRFGLGKFLAYGGAR